MLGRTIKLYLMDGTPSGRWQASISQWNGLVYKIPRARLKETEDIPELKTPGVYFLFGNECGQEFVYVGEADNVQKRILQPHLFEKNGSQWDDAVIYVTPDGSLEKGRIKYLEHYFYKKACDCARYIVKNGNTPTQSPVRREVRDSLMTAVDNIKLIIPTLGYKVFEPSKSADPSPKIMLHLAGKKARAEGYLNADGSIIVRKGSTFCLTETHSCQKYLKERRAELIKQELVANGEFVEDVMFTSLSTAAGCILGASVNGKDLWLYPDGKSFKERNSQ